MMLSVQSLARKCDEKAPVRHKVMLTAETRGRKMERGKSPGYRSKSRKGISKSRSGIVCWKCGKRGYLRKYYKSRKEKEGDAQQENNHEANVTSDVLQDALIHSLENIIDAWVVDSGALW